MIDGSGPFCFRKMLLSSWACSYYKGDECCARSSFRLCSVEFLQFENCFTSKLSRLEAVRSGSGYLREPGLRKVTRDYFWFAVDSKFC